MGALFRDVINQSPSSSLSIRLTDKLNFKGNQNCESVAEIQPFGQENQGQEDETGVRDDSHPATTRRPFSQ